MLDTLDVIAAWTCVRRRDVHVAVHTAVVPVWRARFCSRRDRRPRHRMAMSYRGGARFRRLALFLFGYCRNPATSYVTATTAAWRGHWSAWRAASQAPGEELGDAVGGDLMDAQLAVGDVQPRISVRGRAWASGSDR